MLELNRPYRQAWLEGEVERGVLLRIGAGRWALSIRRRLSAGERAIKYALLFIALTFLTFFAWEQVSGLRLHPLQYLLVGLALSMFYLLLLALSEHVAFRSLTALQPLRSSSLMGVYIAGALRSSQRGMIVACAMSWSTACFTR